LQSAHKKSRTAVTKPALNLEITGFSPI